MKKLLFALILSAILPVNVHAQSLSEVVTATDSSCNNVPSTVCSMSVYRAASTVVNGVTTCQAQGDSSYTALVTGLAGTTVTATGTSWTYTDTTPAPLTNYCYYVVATYTATGASTASAILGATTGALAPAIPTIGVVPGTGQTPNTSPTN